MKCMGGLLFDERHIETDNPILGTRKVNRVFQLETPNPHVKLHFFQAHVNYPLVPFLLSNLIVFFHSIIHVVCDTVFFP